MKKYQIIIVSGIAAATLLYAGLLVSQGSREENLKRDKVVYDLLSWQLQAINELQNDVSNLQKELGIEKKKSVETSGKLAEEKSKRLAEEEKTKQQLSELTKGMAEAKPYDSAAIVNQWRPIIAHVECVWQNSLGTPLFYKTGSGLLTKNASSSPFILTNKHVVLEQDTDIPAICRVKLPDYEKTFSITPDNIMKAASGDDWAQIFLPSDEKISGLTPSQLKLCNQPPVGSNIIILGYPVIGAKTDITATEGIISGYDGNYYITSAKVDRGNSGGTAIFLKNNCYLGIPTFTKTGAAESLARILKAGLIFNELSF